MIIYRARNKINNKSYIGQTSQPLNFRISQHHYFAFTKKSSDTFHKALRKHGKDNFEWTILIGCSNPIELNEMELKYIIEHNSFAEKRTGYNIRHGGTNGALSDETKKKLSKAHTGKKLTKETKDKIGYHSKGERNARFIHLTQHELLSLYNDFISCLLTNKQLEEKYKMSRPAIYRKVRGLNPNLDFSFRYKKLNAIKNRRTN